jgi:L-fucose mutarotase
MLKNIDPLLGPELLQILRAMGHGDELAIVDANFPAHRCARRLVRLDGVSATAALQAVVSVLPLDTFVDCPVHTMSVVDAPDAVPDIVAEFGQLVDCAQPGTTTRAIDRFAFYERAEQAYAVVATGEGRLYGNVLLQKGVIEIAKA